jgi:DNA-binding NarL/FixJ family response regulator
MCYKIVSTMTIDACVIEGAPLATRGISPSRQLAPREREVLDLLSKGRAYKQIAAEMELSMGTIRTYIRRLYGKLHVNCRTEAVVIYLTQPSNG